MKKIIALLLAAVMVMCLFAGCASSGGSKVIKIGVFEPQSGDNGAGGKQEVLGIQYANSVKPTVTINGEEYKIELDIQDNQSSTDKAVSAAQQLVADKVSVVLGSYGSGVSIAAGTYFANAKIPAIGCSCTNAAVTAGNDYYFRVCFLDPQQGKIAGSFVYDNLGFDKAAILYDVNDDYALGLKDNFVKVFESKGGTIVAEEGYTAGDTDFTAQLTKIKEAQPQIIFTPIFYQDFIMIHKQARTLGIEVPMLGGDGCASEVLFDAADAVDGSYVINHVSLVDPAGDAFRKEYAEKYNGAKMELNGYMAHDAFLLWCAAVEKAGSDDPQAIADAYSQVEVEGMAGKIKISAEDHNPVGKSGCVERIDGKNKTYVFETYIAAD